MNTLFVPGGHGFVGQWVQRMAPDIATRHGYQLALAPPGFDLLDPAQVLAQLEAARPDAILHLAAQSNVPKSFEDPESTLRVNVLGTLHLLEGVKRARLSPRLLFASSGDVYGHVPEAEMPIDEKRLPRPRNPYAVSKLAAEALCFQWSQTEGTEVMIARSFNHIGAGQSTTFALPSFAEQIGRIKVGMCPPVIEAGDIDVTRDFTHVADVVGAYLTILEQGLPGEIYNVASGKDIAVRRLLDRMLEIAGVEAEIRRDPARFRHAEQRAVRGCNAKIASLGWRPEHSIDDALRGLLQEWEQRTKNG